MTKFIKSNWFAIAATFLLFLGCIKGRIPVGRVWEWLRTAPSTEKYTAAPIMAHTTQMGMTEVVIPTSEAALGDATIKAFVQRFAQVAVNEQKKFGIPASVILGTALLQSHAGNGPAAKEAFNFFNIPCDPGSKPNCLKRYQTAWESFRGFGTYLETQSWFIVQKQAGNMDKAALAQSMQKNLYAQVLGFEESLLRLIDQYELHRLDK
jgi:flagellum-specific peptidoglycan hydrolase FlgJ